MKKVSSDVNDDRKHHFVPSCYLKAWGGWSGVKQGFIRVQRLANGKVHFTNPVTDKTFVRRGLYNMATVPEWIRPTDASLLETGMFAKGIEALFSRVMRATLLRSRLPSTEEAASLANFAACLFVRNPACKDHLRADVAELFADDPHLDALSHIAVATFAQSVQLASVLKNCLIGFMEAGGQDGFCTCDVPSWQWTISEGKQTPVLRARDARQVVANGGLLYFLCPLSPKYCLEVVPRMSGGVGVWHEVKLDSEVAELNAMITSQARNVIVLPPNPAKTGTE